MEPFLEKINASKSGETLSSPVWIWFEKEEKKDLAQCLICKKTIQSKTGKTTRVQNHKSSFYRTLIPGMKKAVECHMENLKKLKN